MKSEKIYGIGVSPGVAMGPIFKFEHRSLQPAKYSILEKDIKAELAKIDEILASLASEYTKIIESSDGAESEIFFAHREIVSDTFLKKMIHDNIALKKQNAELAVYNSIADLKSQFEEIKDDYFKERASDISDIGSALLHNLKNVKKLRLRSLPGDVIVVADDLFPSDTANLKPQSILGIATNQGGQTSHTSIIARNLGIPTVVGTKSLFSKVQNGQYMVIDSHHGEVILSPTKEEILHYQGVQKRDLANKISLRKNAQEKAVTTDGKEILIGANVGSIAEIDSAIENGAESIGLFRTEFLYMENSDFPSEEEQFSVYKTAAEKLAGKPVIIRTLDIGGDKDLEYYKFEPELNPFLGYRAIRFCLDNPSIFKTQLRAILRASAFGNVKILYPMIVSVEEILQTKTLLNEAKLELKKENIAYNEDIETGIMIETPAAVLISDKLINHTDFFSIGTNDLTQYLLAVDRGNPAISQLYDFYHPSVLQSILILCETAHKHGKRIGMCGEFAGDKNATSLLLGLGLDELSMGTNLIPAVKNEVLSSNIADGEKLAKKALACDTAKEIKELLK